MKWTMKSIRANLGYNQEEMAQILGTTRRTLQKYETYQAYPNVKVIKKLLEISNVDFNDIIFLEEEYAKSE